MKNAATQKYGAVNSLRKSRTLIGLMFSMACLTIVLLPFADCDAESISIGNFRKISPHQGEFEIIGYAAKVYSCPPCPKGAQCKPCMRRNVLLSSKNEILDHYPQSGDYLVVFTDALEEQVTLIPGKLYKMSVKVLPSATTLYGVHDLELIKALEQN